jgi:transposase-like protein
MKKVLVGTNVDRLAAPERRGGERSETDRSEGAAAAASSGARPPSVALLKAASSEVMERPVRRRFTAEYKRAILKEADLCEAGELGALLRREGLYYSHITKWRSQREMGELEALTPRKRGRKAKPVSPLAKEYERQGRENARLRKRLAQAELIIEVQKKISTILGIPLNPPEFGDDDL